ncbi:membrane protein insertion efficiency factor YidD [Jannaschia aquimarina]|uniref:YidD protein n=1 Tax=Jannaschia aquimarina TaxID=935700 RepID=A0A0D1EMD1_9RHOB|nr:membrane protein insertion efficiency factor YidD [Jannaschia aquimarina]KIT18146.1 putative membrane protein insertion efficiency factor [Jannaschia aquimarina]SNT30439.1 Haemolytic domain-containing protein [Jannaschia aquimarina]
MLGRIALGGIWAYQRWLSPRKGWRCAYSVAHGGTGCSGYVKHAIREHGLWRAIPLARVRFRECKQAALAFAAQPARDGARTEPRKRNDKTRRRCNNACDCGTGAFDGCAFLPSSCAVPARAAGTSKACDIMPCDGDIGCGACQIDVCSCG